MSTDATSPGKPERRVGGYRLLNPLGAGGMSSVFRGVHEESGVEVAVKILPRALAKNPTLLQRFLREAKSAEALEHPNIVAIYDRGVDQGRYYLVLEFVPGGDLHDRIKERGPMGVKEALSVVRPVVEGLRFAASQGLIHRDIKPANLLLTPDGDVKIADLGLALHADDEDERVTREGTTVGTVDYMAPEQARDSRGTSISSDIYSLGCTLYFLLTGQPPFPGGDVADKLNRHINASPPDPRKIRPEIPASIARFTQKMMAKKPEKRFADHDELLAALDYLANFDTPGGGELPPDVLIDDDDDDDDEPMLYMLPDATAKTKSGPVMPFPPLLPASTVDHISLAPIEDEGLIPDWPETPDLQPPERARRRDATPTTKDLFEDVAASDDSEEVGGYTLTRSTEASARRAAVEAESAAKSWVATCVAVGVGLVVLVIGADQILRSSRPDPNVRTPSTREDLAALSTKPERSPSVELSPDLKTTAKSPDVSNPTPVSKPPALSTKPTAISPPAVPVGWVEPRDPVVETVAEPDYGQGVEAHFLPEWATATIPARLAGKLVNVRRIATDAETRTGLSAALDVPDAETVEIADDGPFFEERFRVLKHPLIVRAKPGFRPMIVLQRPRQADAESPPAYYDLGTQNLTLDGLDIVADVSNLPRSVTSLFLCRGGSLTLHNCTVTLINNRPGVPASLVQASASDKPSKIRIDRTLVRGPMGAVLGLNEGPADVVVSRSVIVNGAGAGVFTSSEIGGERKVTFARTLLVTSQSAFLWGQGARTGTPRPLTVRSLGSAFVHFETTESASFALAKATPAPAEILDWQGDYNTFAGWSARLSTGDGNVQPVPAFEDARSVWPGTDAKSKSSFGGVPSVPASEWVTAESMRNAIPDQRALLASAARPSPFLREKTVGAFSTPEPPPLLARDEPANALSAPVTKSDDTGASPAKAIPGVYELSFDTESSVMLGDLGRFVAASIRPGDKLVRVLVKGATAHHFTPLRMPDGVSLEILVSDGPKGAIPSWTASASTMAEALIDVRRGHLLLSNVRLTAEPANQIRHLVRVDSGHLLLTRCRLISQATESGGGLVAFHAPGTQPLPLSESTLSPFAKAIDRPTARLTHCLLISGGVAISADVGRGAIALTQCVVASAGNAFALTPSRVARDRFEADLSLDHCTVAVAGNVVNVAPWPGAETGPDRPWLVASRNSSYLAPYVRKPNEREPAMLRADPEWFARDVIVWQSQRDVFEVPRHVVSTADQAAPAKRADLKRGWIDLWGVNHIENPVLPKGAAVSLAVRLMDRLQPGKVVPGDLAIDPESLPAGIRAVEVGADVTLLGITPTVKPLKRR